MQKLLLVAALLLTPPAFAQSNSTACAASEQFEVDAHVQQIAEAYALDAVDLARDNFGNTLDWSDASVSSVEDMLAELYTQRGVARPSEDQVWTVAKAFGSYIGEVFRRNHGATWGMTSVNGEALPGIQGSNSCALFWPWSKVFGRLSNGSEDNVWTYYQVLMVGEHQ